MTKETPSNLVFSHLTNILLKVSKLREIDDGPLNDALIKICNSACQGLNIGRTGVWLMDSQKSCIINQVTCSADSIITKDPLIIREDQFPEYFSALLQERTIVANDALTHPCTVEFKTTYLEPLNISSMLDCPLRLRGKMIGILCCENIGPKKTWLQEEQSFAATLAEFVSRALIANERNLAEEKLKSLSKIR